MTNAGVVFAMLWAGWLGAVGLILWHYRHQLERLWREPVVRPPVLVLESDDWGAGPLAQAAALDDIASVLRRVSDVTGRPAVMSLALVLAVPDGPAIAAQGGYRRVDLDDPVFSPLLSALRQGEADGVLSLQLHGMEHYWPATLMGSNDPDVRAWLHQSSVPETERLPSALQSRWTDASALPSKPLMAPAIEAAVADEVRCFGRVFGNAPRAVVPPTFVWTREVERAWAAHGVEYIVTPGWRSTQRNAAGVPDGDEGPIVNGDRSGPLTYLVRTDYFEPARGRDATHAVKALDRAVAAGRPCVLENHRDNFIGDPDTCQRSLSELSALCAGALRQHPDLRFLSTVELGRILRACDPQWIVQPWRQRLPWFWQRLRNSGRPWKLMRLTGLAFAGGALVRWLGQPVTQPSQRAAL